MKRIFTMMAAMCVVVAFATTATAQQVEYRVTVKAEALKGSPNDHYVTFTSPVEIPDAVLAPGTYVFSVVSPSIVQVTNTDRTLYFSMFFTAPTPRGDDPGDVYQMTIARGNAAAPARVTKWFLPNRTNGFEFLYPASEESGDR